MAMAMPPVILTRDDLLALPDDGQRHELIDGVHCVSPAPSWWHQRVLWRLAMAVGRHAELHRVGTPCLAPADITLDGRSLLQPDFFVVPPGLGAQGSWAAITSLRLVVEVSSPSTARRDRGVKRDHYLRHAVEEYWIVDPEAQLIERWRPGDERPEVCRDQLTWQPASAPALVLDLAALFAADEDC